MKMAIAKSSLVLFTVLLEVLTNYVKKEMPRVNKWPWLVAVHKASS